MSRDERFFRWVAAACTRRPGRILAALALTLLPAGWAAKQLELRTDLKELLPQDQPSVVDLRRIEQRLEGSGAFIVAIEGDDLAAMKRLSDDLAERIAALPRDLVRYVDKDVTDERQYLEQTRYLHASVAELLEVRERLRERVSREKASAIFDLGLDDESEAASVAADHGFFDFLRGRFEQQALALDRYSDGYFVGEEGRLLAVFVRTTAGPGNFAATARLEREVSRIVAELDPGGYHPSIRVSYTGELITYRAEIDAIKNELWVVSAVCITLILGSIYLFYFEVRAIVVLGASLLAGLTWTFGLAWLGIGYLNSATAFLASIVAGNGINSGIILVARYLEEIRNGEGAETALGTALTATWKATLSGSLAATCAYGALMWTDFRGFSHFGFIGGTGILLCWLANYTAVPVLLALTERRRRGAPAAMRDRGAYGRPFAWLAERAPRATLAIAGLAAVAGVAAGIHWFRGDPFEYDFRKLRNQRSVTSGPGKLQSRVSAILRGRPREGMAVLVDRPEQVALVKSELERQREERKRAGSPPAIGAVRCLDDLLPGEQLEKMDLLAEIRELMLGLLPHLPDAQRRELEPWVPDESPSCVLLEDVPEPLRRPFIERDGRAGLILYVAMPPGFSVWDGRAFLRFAEAIRELRLPDGEPVRSSGNPVIFADMLAAILRDGPRLTVASFVATLLLVLITFRGRRSSALVLLALCVGVSWMIGITAISGERLNFLNFVVIPITFGIGVDYGVNIMRRYEQDGFTATRAVLLETGGAVVLCSLTTSWGYLSLLVSDNASLRSFGRMAALAEISCLLAAVVVLPSLTRILAARGILAHGEESRQSSKIT